MTVMGSETPENEQVALLPLPLTKVLSRSSRQLRIQAIIRMSLTLISVEMLNFISRVSLQSPVKGNR